MRDHEREIRDEIARVKGVIEREEWGGAHLKLYWKLGNEKFFQVVSFSPSDHRSTLNAIGQIRRNARRARERIRAALRARSRLAL